jgi:hypothetical protein
MSFETAVKAWPAHWATCPVYRKDYTIQREGKPDYTSDGKVPMAATRYQKYAPARSALKADQYPEIYSAVGVWSGQRSGGLVVLDVDSNLGALQLKWGEDLNGPSCTSTKQAAAKFLFMVPEDLWDTVADVSHEGGGKQGFEVLWGRMAVLEGEYPGSERYGAPEGLYSLSGDLSAIPPAPQWLIALMQESKAEKDGRSSRKSKALDPYRSRTREDREVIVQQCLDYIPPQGMGEDGWWKIGAMVHSADLGDRGLELWSEWSQRDQDYAGDWEKGDPCAERWANFKSDGGYGIGSLIKWADEYDPARKRFQGNSGARIVEETEAATVSFRQDYLSAEELISKALELEETIEDPAYLDQAKTILAAQGGRAREGALAVDRLIDAHLTFKRSKGGKPADVSQLDDSGFEYLIPGILPKPWLLLVHADGGTGKSAMAMTLCKHVSQGKPFNIHGSMVDVPAGRCLWLNGDQSERITKRQFNLIGVERGVDVVGEWDMQWYRRFCRMQEERKYDLVVIDSLDGCNDSNPYEENRREYALPLKRLARRNGVDFPACSIVVIHHNNRTGGFRGTSAIKAAVDETWNMRKVDAKELMQMGLPFNSRIITVEKSRDDREGQQMVFSLMPDYTYRIGPMPECKTRIKGDGPNDYMLDVLRLMRESELPQSLADIRDDSLIGGKHKERAIKYALQRLEAQKLIERCDPPTGLKFKGRPPAYYRALGYSVPGFRKKPLAQGESNKSLSKVQNPVTGTVLNDKPDCLKSDFVESPGASTDAPGTLDKTGLSTKPFVVKNDCAGTDPSFDADLDGHRVESTQEVMEDAWRWVEGS